MDNKGRVTVVLHWDQRSSSSSQVQQQQSKAGQDAQTSKYSPTKKADLSGTQRPSLVIQTSLDKLGYDGKATHLPGEIASTRYTSPRITVINHDDMVVFNYAPYISLSKRFVLGFRLLVHRELSKNIYSYNTDTSILSAC